MRGTVRVSQCSAGISSSAAGILPPVFISNRVFWNGKCGSVRHAEAGDCGRGEGSRQRGGLSCLSLRHLQHSMTSCVHGSDPIIPCSSQDALLCLVVAADANAPPSPCQEQNTRNRDNVCMRLLCFGGKFTSSCASGTVRVCVWRGGGVGGGGALEVRCQGHSHTPRDPVGPTHTGGLTCRAAPLWPPGVSLSR